jgi:hypothetical protein
MTIDIIQRLECESTALLHAADRNPLILAIVLGNASREKYVRFLAITYHYLRWSGPLLAETAEGLRRTGRCSNLIELLDAKVAEESQHDAWVLDDLRALGANPEVLEATAVPNAVQAYVQWSLTLAQEGSPAYLGAAYALEFLAMHRAKIAADNLCARKLINNIEGSVSFLAGHGEADADHVAQLGACLGSIEDERDHDDIALSASIMRSLYPRFFREQSEKGACGSFVA